MECKPGSDRLSFEPKRTVASRTIPKRVPAVTGSAAEVFSSHPLLGERHLPRYTSYPPATEFKALGHDVYSRWLAELPVSVPVSLYLHIPYCEQLCLFCGYFTRITGYYSAVRDYLELMLCEIEQVRVRVGARLKVGHIHIGGGSPTILRPEDFTRLMDALFQHFDIETWADIAIEIDPRNLDREKCAAYAYNGVGRASIGVQDFSPQVQKAVNREQPYEQVAAAVNDLHYAGIDRIGLDLMYGLPYQTVESVTETAKLALTLEPQRVATFGYLHVPWMRKHQRQLETMPLPAEEERIRMCLAMRQLFTRYGYSAIGVDHYARKSDDLAKALKTGTLKRNFEGYSTDTAETLLGFGLSAISMLPQGYVQNICLADEYRKMLDAGAVPVTRGLHVSPEDRMRRELIGQLMCYYRVDLQQVAQKHDWNESFLAEKAFLKEFQARGLVEMDGDLLNVTVKGQPYVQAVCALFDRYQQQPRHRFPMPV